MKYRKSKIKVIYISGLGRSGSTLLDLILSTSPKVFSLGEVYKLRQLKSLNWKCSCGQTFRKCEFWKHFSAARDCIKIRNNMNPRVYLNIITKVFGWSRKPISFTPPSDNYGFLRKVLNFAPPETEFILDSSKEIGRLIELQQDSRISLYNINIIRDVRGVSLSFHSPQFYSKKKNRICTALKWLVMNSLIIKYTKKHKVKGLNISHTNFCKNPCKYISKIENLLGIKIPDNYITVIQKMNNYHSMGSNRIALKENRQKFIGIKNQERFRQDQNMLMNFILGTLFYPFNKKWVNSKNA